MQVSPEQAAIMAQIAPVLLLAVVVERRAVVKRYSQWPRAVWVTLFGVYGAALMVAMLGGVGGATEGLDGLWGAVVKYSFWYGVGGATAVMWVVFVKTEDSDSA